MTCLLMSARTDLRYEDILSIPHLGGREIVLNVDPCPKPRMTRADKWKKRPATARYWAFKDQVRSAWPDGVPVPDRVLIALFNIPMPRSWTITKRESLRGEPHRQKPDTDNLVKALMDALLSEDKAVYVVMAEKRWADTGSVHIVTNSKDLR